MRDLPQRVTGNFGPEWVATFTGIRIEASKDLTGLLKILLIRCLDEMVEANHTASNQEVRQ